MSMPSRRTKIIPVFLCNPDLIKMDPNESHSINMLITILKMKS